MRSLINSRVLRLVSISIILFICWGFPSYSQVCSGSLGDPVVHIDFGNGAGFGQPVMATNYKFTTGCPQDGQYSVANSISNCFSWHRVSEDHTPGDQNGYMMIVNADFTPGIFYKEELATSLCPEVTYEFAAWILNISPNDPKLPNVSFTVETPSGQVLGTYTTGFIANSATPTWRQYGFQFKNPAGNQKVVLVMRNNADGGLGNDLIIDDITFRPCGPVITQGITSSSSQNSIPRLCEGIKETLQLTASTTFSGPSTPYYQWQIKTGNGSGWQDLVGANKLISEIDIADPIAPGYKFRLSMAADKNNVSKPCMIFSDSLLINVSPKPIVDAGPDQVVFQNQPIRLTAIVADPNVEVLWQPSAYLDDPKSLTPMCTPSEDITYRLTVTTKDGCQLQASDEVFVRVLKELVIPNTFSPNGDGINDSWKVVGLSAYPGASVKVLNRFGRTVFSTNQGDISWSGTYKNQALPSGTYFYLIDLKEGTRLKGWVFITY